MDRKDVAVAPTVQRAERGEKGDRGEQGQRGPAGADVSALSSHGIISVQCLSQSSLHC